MKRYQCIKNVYVSVLERSGIIKKKVAFTQGQSYSEFVNMDNDWSELVDDLGNAHIITPDLLENFKEVTKLEKPQPKKRVGRVLAIVIAVILTVLALIFFR